MPSHIVISLFLPMIFPSIRVSSNEQGLHIIALSVGASSSSSVLPLNIALPLKNKTHVSNHLTILSIDKV